VSLAALTARRADLGIILHSIAACRCLKQVLLWRLLSAAFGGAWSTWSAARSVWLCAHGSTHYESQRGLGSSHTRGGGRLPHRERGRRGSSSSSETACRRLLLLLLCDDEKGWVACCTRQNTRLTHATMTHRSVRGMCEPETSSDEGVCEGCCALKGFLVSRVIPHRAMCACVGAF